MIARSTAAASVRVSACGAGAGTTVHAASKKMPSTFFTAFEDEHRDTAQQLSTSGLRATIGSGLL